VTSFTAAGLIVEVVPGSGALALLSPQSPALATLTAAALEPNPFLAPWFFLPALEAFAPGDSLRVILVRQPATRKGPGALVGLFPLVLRRGVHGLPFRYWTLWQHDYNYLGAPLIHGEHGPACLDALFAWLRQASPGAGILKLPFQPGEGPQARLLLDTLRRWDRQAWVDEGFTRACLEPAGRDAETYLRQALNSKRRTELKRQEKKLAEQGPLEYRSLAPGEDIGPWLDRFLALEEAGWKGQQGTAFASKSSHAGFLRTMLTQGHAAGCVQMLGLFVGDRPVALKCNLRTGPGAVAFKIAYDETQARWSPGVLLELENVRRACAPDGVRWMDSCAIPDHPMINRLWQERRTIQTLLVPTGRMPGEFILGLLPLLRWVKRLFKRRPDPVKATRGGDNVAPDQP
jgi:hypothetical protein